MIGSDKRGDEIRDPPPLADQLTNNGIFKQGIPKELIILFVRDLRRAQQYFQLKEYLKTRFPHLVHITTTATQLASENAESKMFKLLGQDDFLAAVSHHFWELPLKDKDNRVTKVRQRIDEYPLKDPVGFLFFLAHQEAYFLDKNPEVDFEKLQKFTPKYYNDHFIRLQSHVTEEPNTVTVSNLADDASESEIRNVFSTYGVIKDVEMQSDCHGPVANVTFSDLCGASWAQIRSIELPNVCKRIEADGETQYEPLLVKPCKDTRSDAEKAQVVDRMYTEALANYSEIAALYSEDESKRGKDCKDVDYWDHCDWMSVEALANGGYTVRGQRLREDCEYVDCEDCEYVDYWDHCA